LPQKHDREVVTSLNVGIGKKMWGRKYEKKKVKKEQAMPSFVKKTEFSSRKEAHSSFRAVVLKSTEKREKKG